MQSCLCDEWEAIEEGMPGRTTIYGNIIEKEEDTETGKKFPVEGGLSTERREIQFSQRCLYFRRCQWFFKEMQM